MRQMILLEWSRNISDHVT